MKNIISNINQSILVNYSISIHQSWNYLCPPRCHWRWRRHPRNCLAFSWNRLFTCFPTSVAYRHKGPQPWYSCRTATTDPKNRRTVWLRCFISWAWSVSIDPSSHRWKHVRTFAHSSRLIDHPWPSLWVRLVRGQALRRYMAFWNQWAHRRTERNGRAKKLPGVSGIAVPGQAVCAHGQQNRPYFFGKNLQVFNVKNHFTAEFEIRFWNTFQRPKGDPRNNQSRVG